MSLGAQARSFFGQVALFRKGVFGEKADGTHVTADYDRGGITALPGYYSFVAQHRFVSEEVGMREERGVIFRVIKADAPSFRPEHQRLIQFKDAAGAELVLRIEDIAGAHHASVEWVLGCKLV